MKKYYTYAAAGSVRIGVDNFTILIPNNYGDGCTEVIVMELGERVSDSTKFITSMRGEAIKIYKYDCCEDEEVAILSGRYGIYTFENIVIFEKWTDK